MFGRRLLGGEECYRSFVGWLEMAQSGGSSDWKFDLGLWITIGWSVFHILTFYSRVFTRGLQGETCAPKWEQYFLGCASYLSVIMGFLCIYVTSLGKADSYLQIYQFLAIVVHCVSYCSRLQRSKSVRIHSMQVRCYGQHQGHGEQGHRRSTSQPIHVFRRSNRYSWTVSLKILIHIDS